MKNWTIVGHWSGGGNNVSQTDRKHYQAIVSGSGSVEYGDNTPEDQISTSDGIYGAHTRAFNTKCIGVALAGMLGAKESPLDYGSQPINEAQWHTFAKVIAAYCIQYGIPVTPSRVLTHAEVQPNLGIRQNGKWDVTVLPWDQSLVGFKAVGDHLRELVSQYLLEERPDLVHLAAPEALPANRPTLEIGDRGEHVRVAQADLHELRYFLGRIDGDFGGRTRGAALAFQADNGLETDGVIGPRTWAAMAVAMPRPERRLTEADLEESGTISDTRLNDRAADLTAVGGVAGVVAIAGDVQEAAEGASSLLESVTYAVTQYWPALVVLGVAYLAWRGLNHSARLRRIGDAITGANDKR